MCKIFLEAFTKPGYAMEDFLDHTYNTVYSISLRIRYFNYSCPIQLFETEINRKIKREPALAVGPTSKVFPDGKIQELAVGVEGSLAESTQRDFVGEFWAFG